MYNLPVKTSLKITLQHITIILLILGLTNLHAQNTQQTEQRLNQARQQLNTIAQETRNLESERGQAARQLRQADERVNNLSRQLTQTETTINKDQQTLENLQQQHNQMQQNLTQQRQQLAVLIRAAYTLGEHAPLKLLLANDRVTQANRALTYHRYFQQQQSRKIAAITAEMQTLTEVETQLLERQLALDTQRTQQRQQVNSLKTEREQRAQLVATLEQTHQDKQARAQALGQNVQSLEQLLANLRAQAARVAEAKRQQEIAARAEAARVEAARIETARIEAERIEAARLAEIKSQQQIADNAAAQQPPRVAATAQPVHPPPAQQPPPPLVTVRSASPVETQVPPTVVAVASLPKVGGMNWPVSGNLLSNFGGTTNGQKNNGLLIGAPAGSTVSAVAEGTVVFSEWMTGYGLILIIDHGNGYMSLYAHNDTLLRNPGDIVKKGDPIAKVGISGGQATPALYFELRRNGHPVDPVTWLQRR